METDSKLVEYVQGEIRFYMEKSFQLLFLYVGALVAGIFGARASVLPDSLISMLGVSAKAGTGIALIIFNTSFLIAQSAFTYAVLKRGMFLLRSDRTGTGHRAWEHFLRVGPIDDSGEGTFQMMRRPWRIVWILDTAVPGVAALLAISVSVFAIKSCLSAPEPCPPWLWWFSLLLFIGSLGVWIPVLHLERELQQEAEHASIKRHVGSSTNAASAPKEAIQDDATPRR